MCSTLAGSHQLVIYPHCISHTAPFSLTTYFIFYRKNIYFPLCNLVIDMISQKGELRGRKMASWFWYKLSNQEGLCSNGDFASFSSCEPRASHLASLSLHNITYYTGVL